MKNIVIYGAGGFGKEVAWLIENINQIIPTWKILGFIDDKYPTLMSKKMFFGYPLLGGFDWLDKYDGELYLVCSIGKSRARKIIYEKVMSLSNINIATIIDPFVIINKTTTIGVGSIICGNCILTVDTHIGMGVIMNTGASVGHDSMVGNYCTLLTNSMVAGETILGDCCEIGSGAFILQGKKVVSNTVLAPLSSALKDITEPGTYIGNPARRII